MSVFSLLFVGWTNADSPDEARLSELGQKMSEEIQAVRFIISPVLVNVSRHGNYLGSW